MDLTELILALSPCNANIYPVHAGVETDRRDPWYWRAEIQQPLLLVVGAGCQEWLTNLRRRVLGGLR